MASLHRLSNKQSSAYAAPDALRRRRVYHGHMIMAIMACGAVLLVLPSDTAMNSTGGFVGSAVFNSRRLSGANSTDDHLLGGCDGPPVLMGIVYVVVMGYAFLGLAVVCDDFFVQALESLSEYFKLSDDVAGATFMAAGSSAPELFTALVDTFYFKTNVGLGTIIGSAIFNILVIIAASAGFSDAALLIDWRPLVRDVFFYLVSIVLLIGFCTSKGEGVGLAWPAPSQKTGDLTWKEGLVLICWYFVYIIFMAFNERILGILGDNEAAAETEADAGVVTLDSLETGLAAAPTEAEANEAGGSIQVQVPVVIPFEPVAHKGHVNSALTPSEKLQRAIRVAMITAHWKKRAGVTCGVQLHVPEQTLTVTEPATTETQTKSPAAAGADGLTTQSTRLEQGEAVLTMLAKPWSLAFALTIPECEDDEVWVHMHWATFINSCLWIGLISWILVFCASNFGCIVGIDPIIMGVTFLAAGTSVPDAISSVVVAKEGKGGMAVANAIGSNVFDICLGLGIPTFIACVFKVEEVIEIRTDSIMDKFGWLIGSLAIVVLTLFASGWRLSQVVGKVLFVVYLAFVVYSFYTGE